MADIKLEPGTPAHEEQPTSVITWNYAKSTTAIEVKQEVEDEEMPSGSEMLSIYSSSSSAISSSSLSPADQALAKPSEASSCTSCTCKKHCKRLDTAALTREQKKRVQNRNAASKYRERKKVERLAFMLQKAEMETKNRELLTAAAELEVEVDMMKKLMRELGIGLEILDKLPLL